MHRIDRYELRGELGRGGLGVVHRAWDPVAGHEVAIKVLLGAARLNVEDQARFRNEAAAASALSHPSIVRTRDRGVVDGLPFLVMDLVPGGSLADRLRTAGPLAPVEAAALVERVARGVAHAHRAGVIHRDLKPANVLLDAQGEPLLADFGLARLVAADRLTHSGDVLGTPQYMAPEQAAGERAKVGPWSDVYALGATLYELLSGRPPFVGASALAILEQVLRAEPLPLEKARPGLDPALADICRRAMARMPAQRYLTADDLGDALQGWLSTQARRPGRARARPSARPARRAAAVVVAVLGAGAIVAATALAARRGPAAARTDAAAPTSARASGAGAPPATGGGTEAPAEVEALLAASLEREAHDDLPGAIEVVTRALDGGAPASDRRGRARLLVRRGYVRARLEQVAPAREDLDRAIALDPAHGLAHALRAANRALLGDPQGAMADADRAVALAPDEAACWNIRGSLRLQANDLQGALADYGRAVELQPDRPDLWFDRALVRARLNDDPGVVDDCTRALAAGEPARHRRSDLLAARARALLELDRRDEALADAEQALALDPDAQPALGVRALHRLQRGDAAGARADAARAVALEETFQARYALGAARLALGDRGGRADLNRAVELARTDAQRRRVGEALDAAPRDPTVTSIHERAVAGDRAGAEARCDAALREDPDHVQVLLLRAQLRLDRADARGAREDAERALRLQETAFARRLLARACLLAGDLDEARRCLDLALEQNPRSAEAWMLRSQLFERTGERRRSLEDLDRAISLPGGATCDAFMVRAALRSEAGDQKGALEDLAAAERLGPTPRMAGALRSQRAATLMALGRLTEALEVAREAARLAPAHASAWSVQAEVLLALDRVPEAVLSAERAAAADPTDVVAGLRLAKALLRGDQPDALRALGELDRVLAQCEPGSAIRVPIQATRLRAEVCISVMDAVARNDRARVGSQLERLMQEGKQDPDAWAQAARLCRHLQDAVTQRAALDRALALRPGDVECLGMRAALSMDEQGLKDVDQALALAPEHLTHRLLRARILRALGRAADADAELARACDLPVTELMDLVQRARARMFRGDDAGALADLDRVLDQAPGFAPASLDRGHLRRFRDPAGAVQDLEACLRARDLAAWIQPLIRRELELARRARQGEDVRDCEWKHPHPR